jgi:hypothetical protein
MTGERKLAADEITVEIVRHATAEQLIDMWQTLEGAGAGATLEGTRLIAAVETQLRNRAIGIE